MTNFRELAEKAVLAELDAASALIDQGYKVLAAVGPVENYFEMPRENPIGNLLDTARAGLRTRIRNAVRSTLRDGITVIDNEACVERNGEYFPCRITVKPITGHEEAQNLMLVTLIDRSPPIRSFQRKHASGEDALKSEERIREWRAPREEITETIAGWDGSGIEAETFSKSITPVSEELLGPEQEHRSSSNLTPDSHGHFQMGRALLDSSYSDLNELLNRTDVPTIFLDMEKRIRYFNPEIAKLLDLTESDMGSRIQDLDTPVVDPTLLSDLDLVIRDQVPLEREICLGKRKCFLRRIFPSTAQNDRIAGVAVMFVGFPELVQSIGELRSMATLLTEMSDSVLVIGLDGEIISWNKGAIAMYGYTENEALQMSFYELLPKTEIRKCQAILDRIASDPKIDSFESWRLSKHGREFTTWATVTKLVDQTRAMVSIAITERDISRYMQSEENLRSLNETLTKRLADESEALRRSEQKFRTLADGVPALFSYVDEHLRYRYVNRLYESRWGLPAAEIIDKSVEELVGPEGMETIRPHANAALGGQEVNYEATFNFADGPRTMQVTYTPDRDDEGHVRGFFTLVTDVTEYVSLN